MHFYLVEKPDERWVAAAPSFQARFRAIKAHAFKYGGIPVFGLQRFVGILGDVTHPDFFQPDLLRTNKREVFHTALSGTNTYNEHERLNALGDASVYFPPATRWRVTLSEYGRNKFVLIPNKLCPLAPNIKGAKLISRTFFFKLRELTNECAFLQTDLNQSNC